MIHTLEHPVEEMEFIFDVVVKANYDDREKTLEDATVWIVSHDGTQIDITSALNDRYISRILNTVHDDLDEYYEEED